MTVWTIKERNSLVRSNQAFGRDGDRLCFLGGQTPSNSNVIDFVEINTTGNASDYGDLVTSFVHSGGSGGITLIAHGNQAAECSQKNFLTIFASVQDYLYAAADKDSDCLKVCFA